MEAMHPDVDRVLFSKEDIADMVKRMALRSARITRARTWFSSRFCAAPWFSWAIDARHRLPLAIDFMAVSSYGDGAKSSGIVRIVKDLDIDIKGRDVLIVEDILDSGLTLKYLMKNLSSRHPPP